MQYGAVTQRVLLSRWVSLVDGDTNTRVRSLAQNSPLRSPSPVSPWCMKKGHGSQCEDRKRERELKPIPAPGGRGTLRPSQLTTAQACQGQAASIPFFSYRDHFAFSKNSSFRTRAEQGKGLGGNRGQGGYERLTCFLPFLSLILATPPAGMDGTTVHWESYLQRLFLLEHHSGW